MKNRNFDKAAKTREGPVDLRSAKQVSKANRPAGRPEFEPGIAGAAADTCKRAMNCSFVRGAGPLE